MARRRSPMPLPYRPRRKHRKLPWPASQITADIAALRSLAQYRQVPVTRLIESLIHEALAANLAELIRADDAQHAMTEAQSVTKSQYSDVSMQPVVSNGVQRAAEGRGGYRT